MKTTLLFLLVSLLSSYARAQDEQQDSLIKTWIDLSREGKYLIFSTFCEHQADPARTLSYSLILEKTDANKNKSTAAQQGQIEVKPHMPHLLTTVKMDQTSGQQIQAILKIKERHAVITQDTTLITTPQERPLQRILPPPTQSNGQNVDSIDPAIEIGGLILEETRSRLGNLFYEKFYTLWQDPSAAGDFIIKIVELPPRDRAAQIQVSLNDHLIFFQHLQPREELIEQAVELAIGRANNFLANFKTIQQNLNGEERMGNGVF